MVVSMVYRAECFRDVDHETGLFVTLANGSRRGRFASSDLAARKLPVSGQNNTLGTLPYKKMVIPFNNRDGDLLFDRVVHLKLSVATVFIEQSPGRPHDVVAAIDMQDFACDALRVIGKQEPGGLSNFFVRDIPSQRRHFFI